MLVNALLAVAVTVAPAAPPAEYELAYSNAVKLEQVQASCMKAAGLQYLPDNIVKSVRTETERKALNGDVKAMRQLRAEEGFGIWSEVTEAETKEHPNDKIIDSLPAAKLKAYKAAQEQCFVKAVKTVLNKDVASKEDYEKQIDLAITEAEEELNKDVKLAKLSKSFASCLKIKKAAKPTDVAEAKRKEVIEARTEMAEKQGVAGPDQEELLIPKVSEAQVKPLLKKEIKAALDDLECGEDFYAAYEPKAWKLKQKVYAEYGVPFAW
ncbi:hypothetical protein HCN51_50065 [Nonomuraea sp. FMUSA5-5]|uniref:Uncharacterized protein n=1 Tax=Nonomuraea composti TaxID=2720023 RepID=A0ABX1BLN8_9ACTN|nr:hypothetical protein [Nonomuraea sp. FMUSA5-5]NJP97484.1 hypothetical protein [Nonomuraea sp. FMUSA5-5]